MGTVVTSAGQIVARTRLCPFSVWALLYVGGIFVGDILLSRLARATLAWIDRPPIVVGIATLMSLIAVERSYAQGHDCDWLPDERVGRLVLYAASFVVGLFVVLPGVSLDRDVAFPFRAIAGVSLVALVALLFLHLGSHRDSDESSGAGSHALLRWLSLLPVILLALMVAAIVVASVVEIVVHPR